MEIGYYGFLARRVPPARLLATAARRALRAARGQVGGPFPVEPGRLLAALGCATPPALDALLARPRPARPPWTPAALRAALDRHLPGEAERALARAEEAARGRLELFGRKLDVHAPGVGTGGRPRTRWQEDPATGRPFPPRGTGGLDPKPAWAVGRGEHWVALACGAVLAEGARRAAYEEALAASVQDFHGANPAGEGIQWSCPMEAALRAVNLVAARWLLSALPRRYDPAFAEATAALLAGTGRLVLARLEDGGAVPNNHLAADWVGLLACAVGLREWPEAPRWRALACAGLARELERQVHAEGTSFEGSLPYHRLALELFSTGLLLAHGAGRGLGPAYVARLRAAFRALRALLSAGGELPQIGDNDSGRILAFRARGGLEGASLLPLGAALLSEPALLARPGPGDAVEVAWLLGPAALARLARARPGPPPGSASFPRGGFHVLRDGGLEVSVSCGENGQGGLGGHSHNDKLALEVFVRGARAVCDPGSPGYTGPGADRDLYRGTRAHATVCVDGLEQAPLPAGRPFALPEAAGARVLSFSPGGDGAPGPAFEGEHRGFLARAGVLHRRAVRLAAGGAAITDALLGEGVHAVELRWPFATDAVRARALTAAERRALLPLLRIAAPGHPLLAGFAAEVSLGEGRRLLVALALPPGLVPTLAPAPWSPGYGERAAGTALVVTGLAACPARLTTLLLPSGEEERRSGSR